MRPTLSKTMTPKTFRSLANNIINKINAFSATNAGFISQVWKVCQVTQLFLNIQCHSTQCLFPEGKSNLNNSKMMKIKFRMKGHLVPRGDSIYKVCEAKENLNRT